MVQHTTATAKSSYGANGNTSNIGEKVEHAHEHEYDSRKFCKWQVSCNIRATSW